MSNKNRVQSFLGRLENSVSESGGMNALRGREQQCLAPYIQHGVWPGENFVYLGHSSNLEHRLLGTEAEFQRKTTMALLFEARGNASYCVRLEEAIKFEGFLETLSRFERQLLTQLPPETLLGPSYAANGSLIESSFTIWKALKEGSPVRVLVNA